MQGRRKYGNSKTVFKGEEYDSKRERDRHIYLLNAEREGIISDLKRQVTFHLLPAQYETVQKQLKTKTKEVSVCVERAVDYKADFTYMKDGQLVVEDVKAYASSQVLDKTYILKRKMMLYFHGIRIKEVYKPTDAI